MRGPASKDMTCDSVELCESAISFLHIQLMGTNVRLPKMPKMPPMPIWNLQDFLQSRNPEIIPVCTVLQCFLHDNIA